MQIDTKKHLVVRNGTNLFPTEYKNHKKKQVYRCEAISLQTMCVKFCLNVGKLLFLWVLRMSGLYPEYENFKVLK